MSKGTNPAKVLYLHGLGRDELRKNERGILEYNRQKGFEYVDTHIDWVNDGFEELVERVSDQATGILNELGEDEILVIECSSAGLGLGLNSLKQINDTRVRVIGHSGRVASGDYKPTDRRSLERCAHLGTDRASQAFYDSVRYFETITLPGLTGADLDRILITLPWADQVVPVSTMAIRGVQTVRLPMVFHSPGIGLGMLRMPELVERIR